MGKRGPRYEFATCPTCGAKGKLVYPPKGGDGSAVRVVPHRDARAVRGVRCPLGNELVDRARLTTAQ